MNSIDDIPGRADRALLHAAQAGDEEALHRLIAPYRGGLELFCGLMLGEAKKADEAMIQTMRTASSEVSGVGSPAAVRMWIHRIAIRVCLHAVAPHRTGSTAEQAGLSARMRGWPPGDPDPPGSARSEPDGL